MDSSLHSMAKIRLDIGDKFDLTWSYLIPLMLTGILFSLWQPFRKSNGFPTVNYDKSSWTYASAKAQFVENSQQLLADGARKASIHLSAIQHRHLLTMSTVWGSLQPHDGIRSLVNPASRLSRGCQR